MFARSKRFPEEKWRAPSPTRYDPKLDDRVVGPATFKKSPRDRPLKENGPPVGLYDPKYPDIASKASSSKSLQRIDAGSRKCLTSSNTCSRNHLATGSVNSVSSNPVVRQPREGTTRRRSKSVMDLCLTNRIDINITCSDENVNSMFTNAELNRIRELVAEKDAALNQKEADLIALRKYCDELLANLRAKSAALDELLVQKEVVAEKEAAMTSSARKIDELSAALSDKESLIAAMKRGFDEILLQSDEKLYRATDERDALLAASAKAAIVESNLRDEIRIARQNESTMADELDAARRELGDLSQKRLREKGELMNLAKIAESQSQRAESLEIRCQNLEESLRTLTLAHENSEESLRNLTLALQNSESIRGEKEIEADSLKRDLQIKSDECDALVRRATDSESRREIEASEKSALVIKLGEIESARSKLVDELSESQRRAESFEIRCRDLGETLKNLELTHHNSESTRREMEIEANSLKRELRIKTDECDALARRATELESRSESESREKSALLIKLGEIESARSKLIEDLSESQRERSLLIDQSLLIFEENERLQRTGESLRDEYKRIALTFQTEVAQLKDQLDELRSKEHSTLKILANSKTELEGALDYLQKENDALRKDNEEIKRTYDALLERIGPFREQLDLYYAERDVLREQQNESEELFKNLMDKYALLMSHQNQKQKIHHMIKLKDDCVRYREENNVLRKDLARSKKLVASLQDKISKAEGRRRFDPKMAFSFNAQNNGAQIDNNNNAEGDKENDSVR